MKRADCVLSGTHSQSWGSHSVCLASRAGTATMKTFVIDVSHAQRGGSLQQQARRSAPSVRAGVKPASVAHPALRACQGNLLAGAIPAKSAQAVTFLRTRRFLRVRNAKLGEALYKMALRFVVFAPRAKRAFLKEYAKSAKWIRTRHLSSSPPASRAIRPDTRETPLETPNAI